MQGRTFYSQALFSLEALGERKGTNFESYSASGLVLSTSHMPLVRDTWQGKVLSLSLCKGGSWESRMPKVLKVSVDIISKHMIFPLLIFTFLEKEKSPRSVRSWLMQSMFYKFDCRTLSGQCYRRYLGYLKQQQQQRTLDLINYDS